MLLRHDLHAKFYRADDECLLGSANLTGAALGWSVSPNLELLVAMPRAAALRSFETELLASVVAANQHLQHQLAEVVAEMAPAVRAEDDTSQAVDLIDEPWLPQLRDPEQLVEAYVGREDELSAAATAAATSDLRALAIPEGLTADDFRKAVAVTLLQMPSVARVDEFLQERRRFGELRDEMRHWGSPRVGEDVDRDVQTLIRWLRVFLPNRYQYSRPRHTEWLVRRAPGDAREGSTSTATP